MLLLRRLSSPSPMGKSSRAGQGSEGGGAGLGVLHVGQGGLEARLQGVGQDAPGAHEVLRGGAHLEEIDSPRIALLHSHPGADGQRVRRPGPGLHHAARALHWRQNLRTTVSMRIIEGLHLDMMRAYCQACTTQRLHCTGVRICTSTCTCEMHSVLARLAPRSVHIA